MERHPAVQNFNERLIEHGNLLRAFYDEAEQLENIKRQEGRTALLKEGIQAQKYAPHRIEAAVSNLVAKKGMNRNPAFEEVVEKIRVKNNNWNVSAEGVGTGLESYRYMPGFGVRRTPLGAYDEVIEENGSNRRGGSKRRKTKKNKRKIF
jgi:hypothetical protein